MEKTENESTILLDKEALKILNEIAKQENLTPKAALSKIVREKLSILQKQDSEKEVAKLGTYEENSVVYERVAIDLPQSVVNFYRFLAFSKGEADFFTSFIAFDLMDHFNAFLQGITPDSFKDLFSLDAGLTAMAKQEEQIHSFLLGNKLTRG